MAKINAPLTTCLVAVMLSLNLFAADGLAQQARMVHQQAPSSADGTTTLPVELSLTTSGGVSLGAYQAGYLYYLSEMAMLNPFLFRPRVVTGASAGTINSLLTVLALGQQAGRAPAQSLFYKIWTGLSFNELLDVENAPPLALSSRQAMETLARQMERAWNKGLNRDVDLVVGVTATRVVGRQVKVTGNFSVPRQEEKFVFRIEGRGPGKAPRISNYVDEAHGIPQPLLPFVSPDKPDSARKNFVILKKLMFASSAFPLAFPAQQLEFCMSEPELNRTLGSSPFASCEHPKHKEWFVDGSMFDRNPLGLAHRIAKAGLVQTPTGWGWRAVPNSDGGQLPPSMYFVYLDAINTSYPSYRPRADYKRIEALFPSFGAYSQGFVRSSQAKAIYELIDQHPDIRERIDLTVRNYPTASGLLANFFGFFDEKFRIFDYYLGMSDAHRYLVRRIGRISRHNDMSAYQIRYPESGRRDRSWNPYHCMQAVFGQSSTAASVCRSAGVGRDFRILLQVSLDRLYSRCDGVKVDETIDNPHCLDAMLGERPPQLEPMVTGVFESDWHQQKEESRFQYTMRLLEAYQFHFADLGLERDDAWLAMSRIRELLAGALDHYTDKLPSAESVVIRVLGKPALNFFMYQPPQVIIYAAAGKGAELGLSAAGRYAPSRWVRFNFALQFKGLYELLGPEKNLFALTPLIGMELENVRWSTPAFVGRLGLRIGYQFSTGDKFLEGSCPVDIFRSDSRRCSAPVGQVFLAGTFFERIRLQAGLEWFPYFLPPMNENRKNVLNGFLEIGWQWISPF